MKKQNQRDMFDASNEHKEKKHALNIELYDIPDLTRTNKPIVK